MKKINAFSLPTVCLTLMFLCVYWAGCAQTELPKFTAITSMDGLSSNTVTAILKDRYGLIWFATDDGLNKFDGTGFTVYRHSKADTTSLASNDISTLYEDAAGRIWIGTVMGSLHLYDRRKDSFARIRTHHTINSICEDGRGELWAGTTQGLIVIDPRNLVATTSGKSGSVPARLAEKHIHRIFRDRDNQMWVGTANGLFRFLHDRFVRVEYPVNGPQKKKVAS
ncbi:two-component regulator propeller domain-containing protein [Dyadobacter sp. 676]|uniref:Two-component regulator propeller domain-containing protein n=1 Tax=Dyadobacter sp. 676 TaxID=3088362 RepID=A0AAU8FJ37_9BACT